MRRDATLNVTTSGAAPPRAASRLCVAAVVVIAMSASARAQTIYTWLGTAGNGVWQTGTFQNNWAGGVYAPGNGTTIGVVFTGTPFTGPTTITLQGAHNPNVGSLTINGSAGSPLTILITNTNSTGDNRLDFMGTGETLTVESGGSGSRISGTANSRGGYISLITNSENRWAINGASTVFTIEADIVGSTAARFIDKRGTGTLVLSGSNNFAGGTILTAGRLEFGNVNALGNGALGTSTVTFAGGSLRAAVSGTVPNPFALNTGVTGTFDTQANSVVLSRASGLLSGDATTNLVKIGSGTLALGGTSSLTGTITVDAGTLWVQGNTGAASGDLVATTIVVNNGATFQFGNATIGNPNLGDQTYVTLNPGSRAVWQEGENLGGVNLAGGTLDLQQGNIATDTSGTQSWTSGTLTNTATLGSFTFELRNVLDKTTTGTVSISGTTSITGAGSLRLLAGEIFHAAAVNLGSGTVPTVTLGSSTTAGTFAYGGATASRGGAFTLDGQGGTFRVDTAAAVLTLSGTVSGSGPLVKAGAGGLTLTGSGGYAGPLTVSAGTFALSGAGSVGAAAVDLSAAGAAFAISGASGNRMIGSLSGSTGSVVAVGSNTLTVGDATSTTFAGGITGSGGFRKIGSGTLALSNTSSFTGTLTIDAGTLWAQGDDSGASADLFATSIVVNDGSTFQFGSATTGDPNLADTTYLTLNPGGRAVWQEGETFGGVNLAGGTLDMQQGNVIVRGGAVQSWTSGTITNTQANGAYAVQVQNIIDKTTAGIVSISGSASVTGTGSLRILAGEVFHAASENLGSVAVTLGSSTTAGTFAYGGATASRGGAFTLDGQGGTIRVDDAAAVLTLTGTLAGGGSLTKSGPGTLALSTLEDFTGSVSVTAGALELAAAGDLQSANALFVASGASLVGQNGLTVFDGQTLGGYGLVDPRAGSIVFNSRAFLSPGGSVGELDGIGAATFNGGMRYVFEVNDATGTPGGGLSGAGWDLFSTTGALTLQDAGVSPIVIELTSLAGAVSGSAANFDPASDYAWKFVAAGSEIGYSYATNPSWFTVLRSNFLNSAHGEFYVARGDQLQSINAAGASNELYVVYAAVPEPGGVALAIGGLVGVFLAARRRPGGH